MLKENGYTEKEIIDKNIFSFEAFERCGFDVSYLGPKLESQKIAFQGNIKKKADELKNDRS